MRIRQLFSLVISFWISLSTPAHAQPSAGLALQLYAGLTITGAVGSVYSIQYSTNLSQSNAWGLLASLTLPTSPYLFIDTNTAVSGRRFYRAGQSVLITNMVFIPPGTFMLSNPTNPPPSTIVTISRGFWIGKFELTQREYQSLIGTNPSGYTGDLSQPVDSVSWGDATNYCSLFTQQERSLGRIPANYAYRLPTEAEWAYACRAGTSTQLSYGDDPGFTNFVNYAWYGLNSGHVTHPVGQKMPNPWGLYDMYGNVWELCQDWVGPYPTGNVTDPQGPASGTGRVVRGGSWISNDSDCAWFQNFYDPGPAGRSLRLGFRIVLGANQ